MSTKLFVIGAFLVEDNGQQVGEFIGLNFRGGFTVTDEGNIVAVDVSSSELAENLARTEIPLTAAVFGADSNVFLTTGKRKVDMSDFPATIAGFSRVVRIIYVLENALNSATYFAKAQLLDLTHAAIPITGASLNNSGEVSRGVANEFTSAPLTVGSAAGNIRDDVASMYAVQVAGDGIIAPATERAILSNARLVISYE